MSDPDPLDAFLREYQEAIRQGRRPTPADVCRDRPELAARLAARIAQEESKSQPALSALPRVEGLDPHLLTMAQHEPPGPLPSLPPLESSPSAAAAAAVSPFPGVVAGFRLKAMLGQGGMGAVYLAEDERIGRKVAIKLILPKFGDDPGVKARFLREARAQAAIEHDNVAPIYQVGEENGLLFLVMPLLRGETLSSRLRRDPQPPLEDALRIALDIAEGLAAAHATGVIHRDMKPGNVWLDGDPKAADPHAQARRARILDFGLARAADPDAAEQNLTQTGAILGTPSYMSPEQASGLKTDARTDLFALGVMMYEMATGTRPFEGPSAMATLINITTKFPPAASSVNPEVPPLVSDLVHRLMAKDPADRPASAAAVAAEIRGLLKTVLPEWRSRPRLHLPPTSNPDTEGMSVEISLVTDELSPVPPPSPPRPVYDETPFPPVKPVSPVKPAAPPPQRVLPVLEPQARSKKPLILFSIGTVGVAAAVVAGVVMSGGSGSPTPTGSGGGGGVVVSPPPPPPPPPPVVTTTAPSKETTKEPLREPVTVTVRVSEPGVSVRTGNPSVAATQGAKAGEYLLKLDADRPHAVRVEKDGFAPIELTVEPIKTNTYTVTLLPLTGRVVFRPFPAGTKVEFSEEAKAAAGPAAGEYVVRRGPHTAKVSVPGRPSVDLAVNVPPVGDKPVEVTIPDPKEITGPAGLVLVRVPGGTFNHPGPADDPDRVVTLAKPFYVGRTEVTRGQFKAFVTDTGYVTDAERGDQGGEGYTPMAKITLAPGRAFSWKHTGYDQTDDHPVVNVTWNDAKAFCDWLGKTDPTAVYRLPTEAEWDYAARAGEKPLLPFAADAAEVVRHANVADGSLVRRLKADNPKAKMLSLFAEAQTDGYAFTAPVGKFKANAFGLSDMYGNVMEWCEDYYGTALDMPTTNPVERRPSADKSRVVKGAGFLRSEVPATLTARFQLKEGTASLQLGFRVVAELK